MSSENVTKKENIDFVARLIEICGSSQPADISRILKVSYQAAKNYLNGRLPDSKVLLAIAEKTPFSVHWFLTGQGDKFVESGNLPENTLLASDDLRTFVRRECLQIVGEILRNQTQSAETDSTSRIVVLTSDKIKEEKVAENPNVLASKNG
ncbi:MAG TPA: hypothetical protein VF692_08015 [Pyrinomonadaceae bacterium]|jgi:hypothetical protein